MKKNTTASKASLKHAAREEPVVVRHQKKTEQPSAQHKPKRNINNFVGFGEGQDFAETNLVRCNNCNVMIERDLMVCSSLR